MSLADQLRESRSKHTLKSYAAAVKQLQVFKAVRPMTSKKWGQGVTRSVEPRAANL